MEIGEGPHHFFVQRVVFVQHVVDADLRQLTDDLIRRQVFDDDSCARVQVVRSSTRCQTQSSAARRDEPVSKHEQSCLAPNEGISEMTS